LFTDSWIDYDAFMNMETEHIIALFHEYPLGVGIKFQKQYKEWKKTIETSTTALVDHNNKKVILFNFTIIFKSII